MKQKSISLIYIVIPLLMMYGVLSLLRTVDGLREIEAQTVSVQQEAEEIKSQNAEMIYALEHIRETMELQARTRLGYVAPGEKIIYDIDSGE